MARKRVGKMLVNIPSSENTGSGRVDLYGSVLNFRLRCTVKRCGWRQLERFYASAQQAAFSHAGQHQFPGR